MPLTVLTDLQLSNYLGTLDLTNAETQATLNEMLLLSPATFSRAVSAIAQGLFGLGQIRGLPAMNDRLVEALIATRLGATDQGALQWSYATQWLPASIDVPALRAAALGPPTEFVVARLHDLFGDLLQPLYDFTGTDETRFFSYAEARAAYALGAGGPVATAALAGFAAAHAALRLAHPELLQAADADCPVLAAVLGLATGLDFLERPGAEAALGEVLALLLTAAYRHPTPSEYAAWWAGEALPAMAAAEAADPDHSGLPGAQALLAATPWPALPAAGLSAALAGARLARVYLPAAYGAALLDAGQLAAERATEAAAVAYLDAARAAALSFRDGVSQVLITNVAAGRPVSGGPVGLLLLLTNP